MHAVCTSCVLVFFLCTCGVLVYLCSFSYCILVYLLCTCCVLLWLDGARWSVSNVCTQFAPSRLFDAKKPRTQRKSLLQSGEFSCWQCIWGHYFRSKEADDAGEAHHDWWWLWSSSPSSIIRSKEAHDRCASDSAFPSLITGAPLISEG